MGCPKCQCEEISASGICLWCGYQVNAPAAESRPAPKDDRDVSGRVETNYSRAPDEPAEEEPPQPRREVSQSPVSIKQKREAAQAESQILASAKPEARASKQSIPPAAKADSAVPFYTSVPRVRRRADQEAEDRPPPFASPPESRSSSEPEKSGAEPVLNAADSRDFRWTADDIASGRSKQRAVQAGAEEVFNQPPAAAVQNEGRMILLSRALSGLVDLVIMALSTGTLIVAAHFALGMHVRDSGSLTHWSLLFVLVYFMYSLLFIGFSNQTVGMMITKLKVVVPEGGKSPQIARILVRCCGYLVSLLFLGIGLLWALFDPEYRCLHDRLTNTCVVRVFGSKLTKGGSTGPGNKAVEVSGVSPGERGSDSHTFCRNDLSPALTQSLNGS